MGLDALFSVSPDARVIHTYRNPLEVVESSIQLTRVIQGLYAQQGDPAKLAMREAHQLAQRMDRFMRFRESHPELADRFVDVKYSELASSPLDVVRRIYEQLDVPLTQIATRRMADLTSNRSRYRRRQANPNLAELGLDPAAEARRFERYCSRFAIDCQFAQAR
jgi:sulfotransferase family protein